MRASVKAAVAAVASMTLAGLGTLPAQAQEAGAESFDGLELKAKSRADQVWVLPEADFSGYQRFMIAEPVVAFARDWERNMKRSATTRVRPADMERIQTGMAEIFLEVFTQELEKAGYAVVEEPGDDVLLLRPAIVDLWVTAPDVASPGRSRTYVTSAGSARLYVELYDSVTGDILARAVDFKRARERSQFQWSTPASNRQEARDIVRRWAKMLVEASDEVRSREE